MRRIELAGKKFGRLTVLRMVGRKCKQLVWLCRCECGSLTRVLGCHLTTGHTRSCGCLEIESKRAKAWRHGLSRTQTHNSWTGMLARCRNKKDPAYKNYGGRGISVCARWYKFLNFLADMGVSPKGLTIERKDNDGNYEPSNCKWATRAEQNRNTRKTNRKTNFPRR